MMKQPLFRNDVDLFQDTLLATALFASCSPKSEEPSLSSLFLPGPYECHHPESAMIAAATSFVASSRPKMIVFDKDGTLGDCSASLRRWVHHMSNRIQSVLKPTASNEDLIRQFHQQLGWETDADDVLPSAPVAAGTWEQVVGLVHDFLVQNQDQLQVDSNNNSVPMPIPRELPQQWHDEMGDLHGQDTPLIEDMAGMMRACQQMGYIVAICTSDNRKATTIAMQSWNIDTVVQASICGDEVTKGKPSAVPLQTLCQHVTASINDKNSLPMLPQDCIVVGDTTSDTGMAHNAGAGFCVGVLTGSGTTKQLLETGAHLVLPNVGHIPALLQTLERLALTEAQQ